MSTEFHVQYCLVCKAGPGSSKSQLLSDIIFRMTNLLAVANPTFECNNGLPLGSLIHSQNSFFSAASNPPLFHTLSTLAINGSDHDDGSCTSLVLEVYLEN